MRRSKIMTRTIAVAFAATLGLSACSSTAETTSSANGALPDKMAKSKTIVFGADFTVAPYQFVDKNGQQTGINYDMCNALAKEMGLKPKWANLNFDGLIPATVAGRVDAICTGMFIKPERAKAIDFVPYMTTGQSIAVVAGNPKQVKSTTDLCGLNAVVQLGAAPTDTLKEASAACQKDGKKSMDIKYFKNTSDAVLQLTNGRADVWMGDDPEVSYYAKSKAKNIAVAVQGIKSTQDGIGVSPQNSSLTGPITVALYRMKHSGEYAKILQKWGIEKDAIDAF